MVKYGVPYRQLFLHRLVRKLIAILFLSLLMLQAIPVLHFFSSQKAVFYSYVDEEKPDQKSKAEKEDYQKEACQVAYPFSDEEIRPLFLPFVEKQHSSPYLEALTPPPDAC